MQDIIKVSHRNLGHAEIRAEKEKWPRHPAYAVFLRELCANNDIVVSFNRLGHHKLQKAEDFPHWLQNNILLLSDMGIGVSIEMENGAVLSNSLPLNKHQKTLPHRGHALRG